MKLTVSMDCCKGNFTCDVFQTPQAMKAGEPIPITMILPGPNAVVLHFYPKTGACTVAPIPFEYDEGAPEDIIGTVSMDCRDLPPAFRHPRSKR